MSVMAAPVGPVPVWPADHPAERPWWRCLTCNTPWPCDAAIAAVAAEVGTGRAFDQRWWAYFDLAALDLRYIGSDGLITRFIQRPRLALPPGAGS